MRKVVSASARLILTKSCLHPQFVMSQPYTESQAVYGYDSVSKANKQT